MAAVQQPVKTEGSVEQKAPAVAAEAAAESNETAALQPTAVADGAVEKNAPAGDVKEGNEMAALQEPVKTEGSVEEKAPAGAADHGATLAAAHVEQPKLLHKVELSPSVQTEQSERSASGKPLECSGETMASTSRSVQPQTQEPPAPPNSPPEPGLVTHAKHPDKAGGGGHTGHTAFADRGTPTSMPEAEGQSGGSPQGPKLDGGNRPVPPKMVPPPGAPPVTVKREEPPSASQPKSTPTLQSAGQPAASEERPGYNSWYTDDEWRGWRAGQRAGRSAGYKQGLKDGRQKEQAQRGLSTWRSSQALMSSRFSRDVDTNPRGEDMRRHERSDVRRDERSRNRRGSRHPRRHSERDAFGRSRRDSEHRSSHSRRRRSPKSPRAPRECDRKRSREKEPHQSSSRRCERLPDKEKFA